MCILFIFSPSYRHAQKTFQGTYCIKMPKRALGKSYSGQKAFKETFYPDINTHDLMIWIGALYK